MLYPSTRQWGKGTKTWERRKRSETVIFPNAKELRSTSMMSPSRESQTQLEEPVRDFHYTAGLRDLELRPEARLCMTCAQFQVAAQQQESATTQKAEREVSHMVVVMVGSFCLCYVPYAALAMYIVNNRNHGIDLRLVTIPAFFSKSSCVYNPIIYGFMNKQVKLSTYIPMRTWSIRPWFFAY